MDEVTDEDLGQMLAWTRISFGAIAFLAPRWAAKLWTGEDITGTTAVMALRGVGAREIALGLGLLMALKEDAPVRGWLEVGALSDAGDALSTFLSRRELSAPRALLGVAGSGAAVVLGRRLAEALG
jgi:hypothetical protein